MAGSITKGLFMAFAFPAPLALLALAAATTLAAPAYARPALVAATPAASTTVAAPRAIRLAFSEPVALPASALGLVMTSMPGMAHHDPMTVKGFATSLADDGRTLVATLPRALPAGTYRLAWHAVGQGGESADGTLDFTAK
jgi:methionine-rich copper-binding protein CopC